ncbi:MAG: sensor histidine kinase [Coriobacteriia bacterium]
MTLIAVLVVGVSVSLAMAALVLTARASLTNQITNNAEARAQDIALLAKSGAVPNPIPGRGEDLLVQVVDSAGRVIASSASIEGQAPLVDVQLAPSQQRTFQVGALAETSGTGETDGEGGADRGVAFLIAAAGVNSPAGGHETVIVAASLDPIRQLIDLLLPRLALGLPLIMIIVGFTVWWLTGRALSPVEAIRSEAEAISATSLERRVPEPGTSDEIGRLAETMNRMLDRLESSALSQQRFVSDASHELKSPIASIRTMLDVARRENPVDFDAFLNDLALEDLRLEHLVNDLLVLARFDERSVPARAIEVDLDDVVLSAVAAEVRLAKVDIDISGLHPARVNAVPSDIESLVRNLVENASRHARSRLWVTLEIVDNQAVLTVSDDGVGIAEADRARIFERFVRLDESRGRTDGGTGLGLAVCLAIARSLGGGIRVADSQHSGATFEVTLPLTLR